MYLSFDYIIEESSGHVVKVTVLPSGGTEGLQNYRQYGNYNLDSSPDWQFYSDNIGPHLADATSVRIGLQISNPLGGEYTIHIDNFSLTSIPPFERFR